MESPFELALDRAHMIQNDRNNPQNHELEQDFTRLFDKIVALLGDNKNLMFQFEQIINRQGSAEQDESYQRGFHDCMYLLKWMDAFSLD